MTIDGKNIYTEWGCTLLEGSFDDLLKYPKRKAVTFRNWAEADGIDPDLSVVEFEPRKIKLSFLMEAYGETEFWQRYRKLTADLSAPGYRSFDLIQGMTNSLRYDAGSTYDFNPLTTEKNVSSFDLSFIEDNHAIIPTVSPFGGINLRGQFSINGIDFGEFGIGCDDSLDTILKSPDTKDPFSDGRTVDLSTVKLKHREIKLSLWMMAGSVEEFLNNYRAFFTQLTGAGTQDLYIKTIDGVVQVYYSDCPSYKVEIWQDDSIMTRFTITLVAPVMSWVDAGGDLRYRVLKDKDLGVLADENGKVIVFN